MSREVLAGTGHRSPRERALAGYLRLLHGGEDLFLTVSLAAMMILPLAEIVLRGTLQFGVPGSTAWVQHLVLIVGMSGGAVAAREGRLLSLSTGVTLLPAAVRNAARVFAGSIASAVTVLLAVAAWQFVGFEREGGLILAAGVPVWVVQMVMPIGFGLVALRILLGSAGTWSGKLFTLLLCAAFVLLASHAPVDPADLVAPALILLLGATVLGAPVFTALGGAALILFWGAGVPIAAIPVETYTMTVSPTLPTIPLFTLAGYFLAQGGASRRLVRVFQALAGWIRGGPAIVSALVCAFFTAFTGASGVTILALGGLLMPVLIGARYPARSSLGLLTASGSLGLLFPPSLPVILYAVVAHTPIPEMFLGGIVPGFVMLALTAWWGVRQGSRAEAERHPFDAREAWRAVWAAKWELLLPAVVLVGIFGGFATLVEAAALTALYAFVVQTVVHRDLRIFRDTPRVVAECGILVGGVLLILGVALGFTSYLVDAQVPARAVTWVTGAIESPLVFLLLLNVFLLIVGCLMDIFSAIVVVVPLILPIGAAFGIDPIHLGIIFLVNMELGYLTPPVGMNLFLSAYRFEKPLPEVYRSVLPMLLVLLLGVLIITYVPFLTTFLPGLLAP